VSTGRFVIELTDRAWVDLTEEEQEVFDDWLRSAKGHDLYMLVRHAKRKKKQSSLMNMKAVVGDTEDG
jgi:hypothetical protein